MVNYRCRFFVESHWTAWRRISVPFVFPHIRSVQRGVAHWIYANHVVPAPPIKHIPFHAKTVMGSWHWKVLTSKKDCQRKIKPSLKSGTLRLISIQMFSKQCSIFQFIFFFNANFYFFFSAKLSHGISSIHSLPLSLPHSLSLSAPLCVFEGGLYWAADWYLWRAGLSVMLCNYVRGNYISQPEGFVVKIGAQACRG